LIHIKFGSAPVTTFKLTERRQPTARNLVPNPQEFFMTNFRFLPLAATLLAASTLMACSTTGSLPFGSASAQGTPQPNAMGNMDMAKMDMSKMDAQMKKMHEMHEKMMAAKTPEERNKLMAEHMKTMQDGMKMMEGMGGAGMSGMAGMQGMKGMGDMKDMPAHHQMMEKRMAMMQSMMQMMMDRMPAQPAR
jgi:hypothetical protein